MKVKLPVAIEFLALPVLVCTALTGCGSDSSPTLFIIPTATPTPVTTRSATATATASTTATPTPIATATATPGPTPTIGVTAARGGLFVADSGNFRVHVFLPPFSDGMDPSLVIGQDDLDGCDASAPSQDTIGFPTDIAFDPSGNLLVVDLGNSRVLRFPTPFSLRMNADLVLGQNDFTSGNPNLSEGGLSNPLAVVVDGSGKVFVADAGNSRILEFLPPLASGIDASVVIGQVDFGSNASAAGQSGLNVPSGLGLDPSGNLWVADNNNNRVLEFVPPFTTGMKASVVVGQGNFTSNLAPPPAPSSMNGPYGVAVGVSGELFVADANNNRVLIFKAPFSNGMDASAVIGQVDFFHATSGSAQSALSMPQGIALDRAGNLWVADTANDRTLEFKPPFTTGMKASLVIGQADPTPCEAGGETAGFFNLPLAAVIKP